MVKNEDIYNGLDTIPACDGRTSNLVYNLGLGLAYQKTTFRTEIGKGLARGSFEKMWHPLFISATVEASD